MMANCNWQQFEPGSLQNVATVRYEPHVMDGLIGPIYSPPQHGPVQEWCVPESAPDWYMTRLGPWTTDGGYSWTQWMFDAQTPGDGEMQYVSGYYSGTVNASDGARARRSSSGGLRIPFRARCPLVAEASRSRSLARAQARWCPTRPSTSTTRTSCQPPTTSSFTQLQSGPLSA